MYKAFRSEYIKGPTRTCDRFDFDWKLLIKTVCKGYRSIEIKVAYRLRSFKESKKTGCLAIR